MAYIRKAYGVPAYRGGRVAFYFGGQWNTGAIKSADHRLYIYIAPDQYPKNRLIFHPADVQYLDRVAQ